MALVNASRAAARGRGSAGPNRAGARARPVWGTAWGSGPQDLGRVRRAPLRYAPATLLAAGVLLALAACASYGPVTWDRRGVDPATFARDDNACRARATLPFGPPGSSASSFDSSQGIAAGGGPAIDRTLYVNCMRDLGYREAPAGGASAAGRE